VHIEVESDNEVRDYLRPKDMFFLNHITGSGTDTITVTEAAADITTSYLVDNSGVLRHRENSPVALRAGTEMTGEIVVMDAFYNTRTLTDTVTIEVYIDDVLDETLTLT
jgi:hypothetical protein